MNLGEFSFSPVSVLRYQIGHIVSCSVLLSPRTHYRWGNLTKVNGVTRLSLRLTFLLITLNPAVLPVALDISAEVNWVLLAADFKPNSINPNYL